MLSSRAALECARSETSKKQFRERLGVREAKAGGAGPENTARTQAEAGTFSGALRWGGEGGLSHWPLRVRVSDRENPPKVAPHHVVMKCQILKTRTDPKCFQREKEKKRLGINVATMSRPWCWE